MPPGAWPSARLSRSSWLRRGATIPSGDGVRAVNGGCNESRRREGGSPGRWSVLEASRPSLTGRGGELRGRRPGSLRWTRSARTDSRPPGREGLERVTRRFIEGNEWVELRSAERRAGRGRSTGLTENRGDLRDPVKGTEPTIASGATSLAKPAAWRGERRCDRAMESAGRNTL